MWPSTCVRPGPSPSPGTWTVGKEEWKDVGGSTITDASGRGALTGVGWASIGQAERSDTRPRTRRGRIWRRSIGGRASMFALWSGGGALTAFFGPREDLERPRDCIPSITSLTSAAIAIGAIAHGKWEGVRDRDWMTTRWASMCLRGRRAGGWWLLVCWRGAIALSGTRRSRGYRFGRAWAVHRGVIARWRLPRGRRPLIGHVGQRVPPASPDRQVVVQSNSC